MDQAILKRRIILRRVIQALIIVVIFLMAISTIGPENDIFWQLKMGEDIWENHHFPIVDTYNFSNPGAVWTLEEWIPSTLFYVLFKNYGPPALILLKAVIIAATFSLFFVLFNKRKVNFYLSLLVFLLAALVNTRGLWAVFPSVFEYLFLVLTIFILEYFEKITWRFTVLGFCVLALIWANSHASFFLLTFILLAYILGSSVAKLLKKRFVGYEPVGKVLDHKSQVKLLAAAVFSLVAPFLTPNGYFLFIYPFRITFGSLTGYISEYQRFWQVWSWNFSDYVQAFTLILTVSLILLFIFSIKRLNPIDLILGVVFIGLFQSAVRHGAIFALVSLYLITKYIAVWFGEYRGFFKRTLVKDIVLILFVISFAFYYKTKVAPFGFSLTEEGYPKEAAEFVINNKIAGNMFNHYNYGGYLIWKMPQQKVFIDGRLEMYEGQVGVDYRGILEGSKASIDLLNKYNINFVLEYSRDPIVGALLESGDWRFVHNSDIYSVFVRNTSENSAIISKYWTEEYQEGFKQVYKRYVAQQINLLGIEQVRSRDTLKALDYFERAVEFDPSFMDARLNMARGYVNMGWWNEARTAYSEILKLDEGNEEAKKGIERVNKLESASKKIL